MASDVFMASLRTRSARGNKISRIKQLFDAAGFAELIAEKDLVAIKTHVGERGNDTYMNPVFVRQVVDRVRKAGGRPFVTDTNTLYLGGRSNSVDHFETAMLHGFSYSTVGAPFIVADGLNSENEAMVKINLKHFTTARVAGDIVSADSMMVISHVKGHELSGFGGAIKNLAMGCASRRGKHDQHQLCMVVDPDKCVACGTCAENCPEGAITMEDDSALIAREKCVGCGECMTVCEEKAISIDFSTDIGEFMERMTEYAFAAAHDKPDRVGYINLVMDVTPDCDCIPWSDAPIVPDIGILASKDPVALDQASVDLIDREAGLDRSLLEDNLEPGADKFTGLWKHTQGKVQLTYGESIGLGSTKYNLIDLDK
ncbi:MAG: DUF362 domain-containing protein [Desulfatibacillaceae bacterium]